jgi:hypothetical protein
MLKTIRVKPPQALSTSCTMVSPYIFEQTSNKTPIPTRHPQLNAFPGDTVSNSWLCTHALCFVPICYLYLVAIVPGSQ